MKKFVFIFPLVLFFCLLSLKITLPEKYMLLIQEDSVIENTQAFFFFLSSLLSIWGLSRSAKNKLTFHTALFSTLAVVFMFISMEEISWGQRVFNITNPEYFSKHNIQNEISIHNLDIAQPILHYIFIVAGAYGAFAWVIRRLLRSRIKTELHNVIDYIVPDWYLSSNFIFVFLIYFVFEYVAEPISGSFLVWRDQEPAELLFSLGILSFTIINISNLRIDIARADK